MTSSPFVVGQWVRGERFYGRAELIEELLEGNRNWIWVVGTRRVGKTSLLKQLEWVTAAGQEYFPVAWDFQGAEDPQELHLGLQDALFDAEERLEKLGIQVSDLEGSDVFDTLSRLRRKLRGSERHLLLLCDEVEQLIQINEKKPGFLGKLRRAMQSHENIRSVLTSTIRLWVLSNQRGDTSPFLHGFTPPVYIHGLTDEEARELIRQGNLPSDSRPAFDEDTVEKIRACCDNHPYLIQLVCKRFLELGDLPDAIDQVAGDQMVSYFFAVDFEMLSDLERDVIRVVAEESSAASNTIQGRIGVESDNLSSTLHRLENLGYLRRNAERRFELVNHFFRRWLQDQLPGRSPGLPAASPGSPAPLSDTAVADHPTMTGGESLFHGRYRLLQKVGEGATGMVYKARDEELRTVVGIKLLKRMYSDHAEFLERFRQEILLSRELDHPNILTVYDLGDSLGNKYLTMKWIDGRNLAEALKQDGALPIERAVELSCKLASALEAAHGHSVIHRDIKPENVLVDDQWEPYLTDFGLARILTAPGMTQSGIFMGTPEYASPEQAKLLPTDERSDLYALGLVILAMLIGRSPFGRGSLREILERQKHAVPPDPVTLRPDVSPDLGRIVLRCLEKEPARRFQSAGELRTALMEQTR